MNPQVIALLGWLVGNPDIPCQSAPPFIEATKHEEISTVICVVHHMQGDEIESVLHPHLEAPKEETRHDPAPAQ